MSDILIIGLVSTIAALLTLVTLIHIRTRIKIWRYRSDPRNPVHYVENDDEYEDGWYFWDETWSYRHGPYYSSREALNHLKNYIDQL